MDAAVTAGSSLANVGRPPYTTVAGMVAAVTAAHSGGDAVVTVDGETLSYAEVELRSAEFALGLLGLGIGKGTRVGVLIPTGPDWVVAALAVMRIGAVLVPINTFVRAEELIWFLRHADVHTLLVRPAFLRHRYLDDLGQAAKFDAVPGPHYVAAFPALRHVVAVGGGADVPPWVMPAADLPRGVDAGFLRSVEDAVDANDAAVVVYSSGSTSQPKGAIHPQATVVRLPYEVNHRRGLVATDRVFMAMPFFWVGGMHHGFLAAYGAGACMVTDETFEVARTVAAIERERITVVFCWPHQATAIRTEPTFAERDLSSLRPGSRNMVLPAGISEDPTHRSNWLGMSETFGAHLIAPMQDLLAEHERGTMGRSVPGVEHRVVDPESGEPCGPNQAGVLDVRGYSVMLGRVRAAREDVFQPGGWYRTGDLGHFDENGFFFFDGRGDDVIKAGGVNVSPDEVEAVLRAVDGVHAAYVIGLPDAASGATTVVAAVVAKQGMTPDPDRLLQAAKQRLSAYKVPKRILLVTEAEIPMTATGKVRRGVLAEQLADR